MLERPTEGNVIINGQDIGTLKPTALRDLRHSVSMIFQGFNLLMQRTCLKNICFPMELAGVKKADAVKRAKELLEIVGLPNKANAYPAQLSGGQKQRIAIARALASDPKVLLCDEATSALDPQTTHSILELIREINEKTGITVVIITHQMSVVEEICNRVAILDDGRVAEEGEVSAIFSQPKSSAARKLVFPDSDPIGTEFHGDERRIRVVFNGAVATNAPLITRMAIDTQIVANILSASTKCIGNKMYGNMLLGVSDDPDVVQSAINYLRSAEDVWAEEVTPNAE